MYHDSEDEPLSGDDETEFDVKDIVSPKRKRVIWKSRTDNKRGRHSPYAPDKNRYINEISATSSTNSNKNGENGTDKGITKIRKNKCAFKGYNPYPVVVVDYDLTLVDRASRPFPGSHEFIEKLREFNDGQLELILYSHGSPAYIDEGLNKHYGRERKYFDEIISENSPRDNKPVTHVRRVIKRLDHLIGPYIIIDDARSNLDDDQYDIVIDITRMTKYDEKGRASAVDYDACYCLVEQGVQAFLNTKKKCQ